MTDRILSLLVTLEKPFRTDDIEPIIEAISMIKFVGKVEANIFSGSDQMNAQSARNNYKHELIKKLLAQLEE